jgi:hypothetical protein
MMKVSKSEIKQAVETALTGVLEKLDIEKPSKNTKKARPLQLKLSHGKFLTENTESTEESVSVFSVLSVRTYFL